MRAVGGRSSKESGVTVNEQGSVAESDCVWWWCLVVLGGANVNEEISWGRI